MFRPILWSTVLDRCLLIFACAAVSSCLCAGCGFTATGKNVDGKRLFEQGQYTSALQKFQQAVANNPKNADAYYNMAATYHRLGTQSKNQPYLSQAEALYNQCLDIDPNHVDCYRGLAVLLVETDRPDRAFTLLKNWAGTHPAESEAQVELARLYGEFGKKDVAKQYLEHAVQLDQRNDRAWRALAVLREESGDLQQALANYQRSYQINMFQPDVANRIAGLQQSLSSQTAPTAPSGPRLVTPSTPGLRY